MLAGAGGDDRGGVGVLVGVDPDDDVDAVREDGHDAALLDRVGVAGSVDLGAAADL
jgi:hypothetical protein